MAMMSDDGDRVCPLCAEEMDLTDQQLKPCKCGYEICVWCWHHIMEMAEKEETDGRCPACRTPYDKEKIVGMAANCERLVAGINTERRHKSQKVKPKASAETRKQLSTVRVIQRNLVYIIGLPANLCNENLLERKEFFGQYGKVLKVSISRSASSTNQQASSNNTFGVYITYAREEAAVRCIQAVHNYVLDGKPLRACFGTTKYCHAWLRNMICSNPDCLYLHDIGSQEDSFTKDEIISPATRVPHISSNSLQKRAGSLLPPPADDLGGNGTTTGKHSMKNVSNNTIGQAKSSISCVGIAKPAGLPAAASWGSRSFNGLPCSQSSMKQIVETNSSARSSISTVMKQVSSAWNDDEHTSEAEGRRILITNDTSILSELQLPKAGVLCDHESTVSDMAYVSLPAVSCDPRDSAWDDDPVAVSKSPEENCYQQAIGSSKMMSSPEFSAADSEQQSSEIGLHSDSAPLEADHTATVLLPSSPASSDLEENMDSVLHACKKINALNGTATESFDSHSVSSGTIGLTCEYANVDQDVQNACSGLASSVIGRNPDQHRTSLANLTHSGLLKNPASKSQHDSGDIFETSISTPSLSVHIASNSQAARKPSSWNLEVERQAFQSTRNVIGDPSLDVTDITQSLSDATNQRLCSPHIDHTFNESNGEPSSTALCHGLSAYASFCGESNVHTNNILGFASVRQNGLKLPNGQYEGKLNNLYKPASNLEGSFISSNEGLIDRLYDVDKTGKHASRHTGESSIISDMLSLDFDPWDDALSLANNFSRLLSENDGKKSSVILNRPLNTQNSNQSRFSFARQENQESFIESSISDIDWRRGSSVKCSSGNDLQSTSMINGFLGNGTAKNSAAVTYDKPAVFSRAKMSAPPGFSAPSRAPPPGFSVQDRYDQNIETSSEIRQSGNSLFGDHYQVHPTEISGDVEFIDPAILAVGKGLKPIGSSNASFGLSAFPSKFSNSDCHPRFQTSMHQAASSQQNMRFPDHMRDSFLSINNSYIAAHLSAQNHSSLSPLAQLSLQQSRSSPVTHSHWDGWSSIQTSTAIGMTEILRNERFGLNNYYLGKGEHKFHIPSSGDIYGRAFGM